MRSSARPARRFPARFPACLSAALLPGLAIALLAGCRQPPASAIEVIAIGDPDSPFATGPRLPLAAQLVRSASAEGLVALDEQGQVIPAMADRWIVTDDGAGYIFRLRDGTWADGTPLSGETAVVALRRALAGLAGTPLALDFADIDEIRAMAGRVVEIRLRRPVPDLLQLLAQPELGLFHRGRGSGPMQLVRDGPVARFSGFRAGRGGQEPVDPDGPAFRDLQLRALPAEAATRAFAEGRVPLVLGGRFEDLPLARAVAGLSQRGLRLDPAQGLFGLAVVSTAGPLALPEGREALAMAIDREALGEALGLAGWVTQTEPVPADAALADTGGDAAPRSAVLPSTVLKDVAAAANRAAGRAGGAAWNALAPAERQARAAQRIARWKARFGPVPALRLALPAGPGADLVFARLAADLAAIGVPLVRVAETAPADLRVLDLVARYPRTGWYLNQLSCAAARTICSADADASLAAARATPDPAARAGLIARAAQQLAAADVFIPFGTPVRWSLVAGDVPGFAPDPAAVHPLPPLARRPE